MRFSELRKLVQQLQQSGGGGGLTIGDAVDRAPYAGDQMVPLNGGPALVTAVINLNAPGASADVETYKDITGDTSTNLYAVAQIPADAPAGSKSVVSLVAIVPAGGSYYLNLVSATVANLYEQPLG
jgi:hypothetical protein